MIRRATVKDAPILCEIRKRQLVDEGLATEASIDNELIAYFERTLSDGTLVELVFEEEGKAVATAGMAFMPFPPTFNNPVGTRGYVTNMYTAPSHRGRGIASQLLELLMEEARERGVRRFLLSASEMGKPVYRRQGFAENSSWMELLL